MVGPSSSPIPPLSGYYCLCQCRDGRSTLLLAACPDWGQMKTNIEFRLIQLTGLTIVLAGMPLVAHHSFAGFDLSKTITLTGTVKEFQWTNPHSWIQLMVMDASGSAVEWSIEMSAPSSLVRQGWKPKLLKPGDQVTVAMHPLRDGRPGGSLVSATLADGTRIGGSPTGDPQTRN